MQPRTMVWVGIAGLLSAGLGVLLLLPGTASVGPAAMSSQSQDYLHNVVIALHDYESGSHQFFAASTWNDASPSVEMHCWMTHMLPYIFHAHVHSGVDLSVPWYDAVNLPALSTYVNVYENPGVGGPLRDAAGRVLAHYAGNLHVLKSGPPLKVSDVLDGTSQTLFSGEVATSFTAWGQPPNTRDPTVGLHKTPLSFGGPWAGGETNFSFLDGHVQTLNPSIDPAVLNALSTPAGGESVKFP